MLQFTAPLLMAGDWITDRRPTEADGDKYGVVVVAYCASKFPLPWILVGEGIAWQQSSHWQPPTDADPEPTKPALALGQRWRRRDGVEVTIDEHDTRPTSFPFHAGRLWYRPDGTQCDNCTGCDLIELLPANPPTTTRKFASISRTVHEFGRTIDAIDGDGVAWWMTVGPDDCSEPEWRQLLPLPAREVEG